MESALPRRLDHYQLVEKLGIGGMGVVYRAIDTMLDRQVAIKMMLSLEALGEGVDKDEIRERFFREARAAARIQSRNVASVLHLGAAESGELYIVMELLRGQPLNKRLQKALRSGERISTAKVIGITTQICRGMQAAHDLGIVHRDLKPANVMLVDLDGDTDVVKILDFGVAKLQDDSRGNGLTQAGAWLGTLPFMSPEQIVAGALDHRTDIYALGVILYRMFTGGPVFDVESVTELAQHQIKTRPLSMFERVTSPHFSPQMDDVVLRCLEKDPERRWPSMRALSAALEAASLDAGPFTRRLPTNTIRPALPVQPVLPVLTVAGAPLAAEVPAFEAVDAFAVGTLNDSDTDAHTAPGAPQLSDHTADAGVDILHALPLAHDTTSEEAGTHPTNPGLDRQRLSSDVVASTARELPPLTGEATIPIPMVSSSTRLAAPQAPTNVPAPTHGTHGTQGRRWAPLIAAASGVLVVAAVATGILLADHQASTTTQPPGPLDPSETPTTTSPNTQAALPPASRRDAPTGPQKNSDVDDSDDSDINSDGKDVDDDAVDNSDTRANGERVDRRAQRPAGEDVGVPVDERAGASSNRPSSPKGHGVGEGPDSRRDENKDIVDGRAAGKARTPPAKSFGFTRVRTKETP